MDKLISEEAVLDVLRNYYRAWFLNDERFMDAVNAIKAIPSAEPKTGHWIEHENNEIAYIECSECSCWFLRSHLLRNSYCPNCGARMFEKQEEGD